jgi:C1A family cysteine protease
MLSAVFMLTGTSGAQAALYSNDVEIQRNLWNNFKEEFKREYANDEEEKTRFGTFVENLKVADERQLAEHNAGGKAIHGVTMFSDLTHGEFKARLGFKPNPKKAQKRTNSTGVALGSCSVTSANVDWTGVYTSGVRNQGYCGSCWAFSTAGQVQADTTRLFGGSIQTYAPEQLVQCNSQGGNNGCNGGDYQGAYDYLLSHNFETENYYPYTSYYGTTGGPCTYNAANGHVKALSPDDSLSGDESCMAQHVQSVGPLAIAVDASQWSSYWGGIMTNCGTNLDHAVQIVGVYPVSSGGYWKIRNSWSTSWGESGFIRLSYGHNTCGLTYEAWFSSLQQV